MTGVSSSSSLFREGFFGLMEIASSMRRLMEWSSVVRTFTLYGLMLCPVARQCSKTTEVFRDWCSLIRHQAFRAKYFALRFGILLTLTSLPEQKNNIAGNILIKVV